MTWTKADIARIRAQLDGFLLRYGVGDDAAFEAQLPGLVTGMLRRWAANREGVAAKERREAVEAREPRPPGIYSPGERFAELADARAARCEKEARAHRRLAERVARDGLPAEFAAGGWRRQP